MKVGELITWNGGKGRLTGLLVYKTEKDYGVDCQDWGWDRNGKAYTATKRVCFTHAELERLDPKPLL